MRDLEDALTIWTADPVYGGYPSRTVGWRLLPALSYDKLRVYRDDNGKPFALLSYAFLTDEEAKTQVWSGPEVFARKTGDQLWVIDMIANGGKKDVLSVAKSIRQYFYEKYRAFERVYAMRGNGSRRGWYPNKGL